MVACAEPDEATSSTPPLTTDDQELRPRELLADAIFRPLAGLVVRALLPLRVRPAAVVLANAVAGFGAALAIARGNLVAGALLLQVKTVLDNADGQLARASGRTSGLGRYLDTEADLAVNVALFAALAHTTGAPAVVLVALVALTIVLSTDFNERVLYRRARGETVVTEPSVADEGAVARALGRLYAVVFSPQDRVLQSFSRRRLERLLAGVADPARRARLSLVYHDGVTATILANLGLSTQLAVLGACLVLGVPIAYPLLVLGSSLLLPLLQFRRELATRRVVRA